MRDKYILKQGYKISYHLGLTATSAKGNIIKKHKVTAAHTYTR
jgi:hypothetical protein